jgi:hypothetical protein
VAYSSNTVERLQLLCQHRAIATWRDKRDFIYCGSK